MKPGCSEVRYVLVARDAQGGRVAVLGTPRLLVQLAPLHLSLFRQCAAAVVIDVLSWPWKPGETLEQQEPLACAKRSQELPGAVVWLRARDLKAMEVQP